MRVYREVKVTDRLPKSRSYVGIVNTLGDIDNLYHFENGKFTSNHVSCLNPDKDRTFEVQYWLETVELPSDEDIEQNRYHDKFLNNAYLDGVNYILNKIKS